MSTSPFDKGGLRGIFMEMHGVIEMLHNRHGIIRFAHPSGRPVGVQSASALVRLKTCRNDEVFWILLLIDIYAFLY